MGIKFATEEWVKAACKELNSSKDYMDAAKNWEGDMYFIIEPEGAFKEKVIEYFDNYHGECRATAIIADEGSKTPAYRFWAPYGIWKQILQAKMDPIKAMMSGKLNLKGDMGQIMKMPRAAVELVNCFLKIDTEYPD